MFNDYSKSKQHLEKQQKIDLLLVLIRVLESPAEPEEKKTAKELIKKTLDELK